MDACITVVAVLTEAGDENAPVLTMAHLEDAISQIARAREVVGSHGVGNR